MQTFNHNHFNRPTKISANSVGFVAVDDYIYRHDGSLKFISPRNGDGFCCSAMNEHYCLLAYECPSEIMLIDLATMQIIAKESFGVAWFTDCSLEDNVVQFLDDSGNFVCFNWVTHQKQNLGKLVEGEPFVYKVFAGGIAFQTELSIGRANPTAGYCIKIKKHHEGFPAWGVGKRYAAYGTKTAANVRPLSYEYELRILDFEDGSLVASHNLHNEANAIAVRGNLIVAGLIDGQLCVKDMSKNSGLITLPPHCPPLYAVNQVSDIAVVGDHIFAISGDTIIIHEVPV